MRQKTNFQEKCSNKMFEKLKDLGISLTRWDYVDGTEESYYEGEYNGIRLWIYDDGACIKVKTGSYLFEELDYRTKDDLIDDFINKFVKLIQAF